MPHHTGINSSTLSRTMDMYELYEEGYSTHEIGRIYGITGQAVWKFFNMYDLPMRTPAETMEMQAQRRTKGWAQN